PNMIVVVLEGVTSYNSYINHTPPFKWILHPNWYTTAGYRAKNNGMLGRSNGCITVDPVENNQLVKRLQDGALVYVTVGDGPIEQYLGFATDECRRPLTLVTVAVSRAVASA